MRFWSEFVGLIWKRTLQCKMILFFCFLGFFLILFRSGFLGGFFGFVFWFLLFLTYYHKVPCTRYIVFITISLPCNGNIMKGIPPPPLFWHNASSTISYFLIWIFFFVGICLQIIFINLKSGNKFQNYLQHLHFYAAVS